VARPGRDRLTTEWPSQPPAGTPPFRALRPSGRRGLRSSQWKRSRSEGRLRRESGRQLVADVVGECSGPLKDRQPARVRCPSVGRWAVTGPTAGAGFAHGTLGNVRLPIDHRTLGKPPTPSHKGSRLRRRRGSSEAELGSVESCLDGPELGMQDVAVRRFGRERQTQPGGVDRSADVASPVVGQHEVIEHPHRDFMRSPRPHELRRGIGLYSPATSEGSNSTGGSVPK
jgi:hypothetical protein